MRTLTACILMLGVLLMSSHTQAADSPTAIYELRTYIAPPGKLAELHSRFRNHTCDLFKKHGMHLVGFWTPTERDAANNTLIYVLKHDSLDAAKVSWKAFRADPDWIAAKSASEVNGSLTEKVTSVFMQPTDFSPMK